MTTKSDFTEFGLTKEFLEIVLNKWGHSSSIKIDKFTVSQGSMIGDGYTTILLSIQVWLEQSHNFFNEQLKWYHHTDVENSTGVTQVVDHNEPICLVIKCYPENVARQEFLEATDVFTTELQVYDQVTPALYEFQKKLNSPLQKLPFPPFIAGHALTVSQVKELKLTRPLKPLDNYIIMLDIRHHGNFQLRDRFLGFDLDHYKLVIEAQAQLHAISWAFKCKSNLPHLRSRFPALQKEMENNLKMMSQITLTHIDVARTLVNLDLEGNPQILKGLDDLVSKDKIMHAVSLYYDYDAQLDPCHVLKGQKVKTLFNKDNILHVPGPQVENEESWFVLLHGDAWSNNMMFRYDEATGRPVQVILLDLQISREGDPMADIVYALYTGTTREFRSKHLDSMLHIYFDKFESLCQLFQVPTLPGFTWTEFMRRFHRAKFYGMGIAIMGLPIILKKQELIMDAEKMESPQDEVKDEGSKIQKFMDMFGAHENPEQFHPAMRQRLGGLLEEMSQDGVF